MQRFRPGLKLIFTLLFLVSAVSISVSSHLAFTGGISAPGRNPSDEGIEFFEKRIRPILAQNCAPCHNKDAKLAGLDLTSVEGFLRGGESGALVDRENPSASRLLKVVGYQEKIKMPPSGKLGEDQITDIAKWVMMGAPWPGAISETGSASAGKRTGPTSSIRNFTEAEKNFWAFQPVIDPSPPKVKNSAWIKNPIDAFILSELEKRNLEPAPPADKPALLRRATYDLTGLPPTENEIADFLADDSTEAYRKVIERLLSSPRYGERWGRHWLDVARYADSTGNDEDHRYPHAWRYRDYVIEAFNRDLPYDQFIREQLAGDMLPAPAGERVNRRGIIATGFLALGPKALAQQDKKKMLYDVYDEQVDVTTRAFLGLTVSCARCHNHKFDPLLTRDYYSMAGIFASTRSFSDPMAFVSQSLTKPLIPAAEFEIYKKKKDKHQDELKKRQLESAEIIDAARTRLSDANSPHLAEYMVMARSIYEKKIDQETAVRASGLDDAVMGKWVAYLRPGRVRQHLLEWENGKPDNFRAIAQGYQRRFNDRLANWKARLQEWRGKYQEAIKENKSLPDRPQFEAGEDRFFSEIYFGKDGPLSLSGTEQARFKSDEWRRLTVLKGEIEQIRKNAPAEPEMACAVEEGEIVNQKVHIRGDYHNEGEDAPKGFPLILADRVQSDAINSGSGRRELAEWIARPGHPLTARVMVNRIWGWHFGEGIVRTPDNFGRMGEPPTHPEMLDYLAARFIADGWSIKSMHRLIMLSNTYRMSSRTSDAGLPADPENKLQSRFNRRRLSVEEMRDALLAIDGSLDLTMGGTLQEGTGTDGENDNKRLSLNPEKLNRRTVYLPLRRANLPTLLNLFDFGDATSVSGKRQLTNVATQALFWMNSEFLTERSLNVARALDGNPDLTDEARIDIAYLRILNRHPIAEEISTAREYLASFGEKFAGKTVPIDAWQSLCRILMTSNDFIYID